jgi:lipopolysaccharide/colanic/teichoic acid biosynthesis glycosyltransferase
MDIALSALALLLLSPLFAVIALLVVLDSRGPVFFRADRVGFRGRPLRMLKFRKMRTGARGVALTVTGDERLTRLGAWLVRTKLDELPQLWHVLRGEMSLVGPRPLIIEEDRHIVGHGRRRLDLTPGLTGLWQVMGRSDIPFAEMVTLDYLYVTNWSLWGDLKLLARTLPAVMRGRGAY